MPYTSREVYEFISKETNDPIVEWKSCKVSGTAFPIYQSDLDFYEKISPVFNGKKYAIPTPTLCPEERERRRLASFSQTCLYHNVCAKCHQNIISRFSPTSNIVNYCNACWSDGDRDQLKFWKSIDWEKSLLEQVEDLVRTTPFMNLIGSHKNVEYNAVYTNYASEIQHSYRVSEANKVDNAMYASRIKNSNMIVDSLCIGNSEYVYECTDSYHLYDCYYCRKSFWCKFSYLLDTCHNCEYCIGCHNLHDKKYYIFNQPVSKAEYEQLVRRLSSYQFFMTFAEQVRKQFEHWVVNAYNIVGSERSYGDNIINSNACILSFDMKDCDVCKYSVNLIETQDTHDVSWFGGGNTYRMYESAAVGRHSHDILFSSTVWKGEYLWYCIDVRKSKYCFLCVNLKGKEYCILNKQYTREEYNQLVPKLIEKMKADGEWGEFLPPHLSPFGYNETLAAELLPLSKQEAIQRWFRWSEYENPLPQVEKIVEASALPDDISQVTDDILSTAIKCEISGRPFIIVKQELAFYRKHRLPLPRRHPNIRHEERVKQRSGRTLYLRACDKCGKEMLSIYPLEDMRKVYCEGCYRQGVYG